MTAPVEKTAGHPAFRNTAVQEGVDGPHDLLSQIAISLFEALRPHPFEFFEPAYVGDMPQDMTLARNAGMSAIGVENRMFSADALIDGGATTVIKALGELKDLPLLS